MSMTPERAICWRDLCDQLTPEQIDTLIRYERESTGSMGRAELLAVARGYGDCNVIDAMIGPVAAPAGAVIVDEWCDALTPYAYRVFHVHTWTIPVTYSAGDGVDVTIQGTQKANGKVDEHGIRVTGGPHDLITPEEARGLAAALVAAADEIDSLAAR